MAASGAPLVTVALPSFNQGRYLEQALASIFEQDVPVEVFVVDGGSTDQSLDIIHRWAPRLAGWRSHPDAGQAAAINEAVASGRAPFVCWLNSDDWFLPGGLSKLVSELMASPDVAMVYGRAWDHVEASGRRHPVWVERFSERRLATRCIVSQPATLMRREAWVAVGGVNPELHLAMDYDLWWRLFKACDAPRFVDAYVAVNRVHSKTKTSTQRARHYREAMATVRQHYGVVPLKWWLAQPYAVWFRSWLSR